MTTKAKVVIGITFLAYFLFPRVQDEQVVCESNVLGGLSAKEILNGPEYEMFLGVVTAFGRNRNTSPRLYFVPGPGNSFYIPGSVFVDGRGKILMSRTFVSLMGDTPALKGVMAHEMAHLAVDTWGNKRCALKAYGDPREEQAADALAAHKVGFDPVRAFFLRIEEVTGAKHGESAARLQELEKIEALEAQDKGQR